MTRLFRAVYGGGPGGGRWSAAAKQKTVVRLLRMVVRLTLGPHRVAEYDALIRHFDSLTPAEMDAEIASKKRELRAILDRDLNT